MDPFDDDLDDQGYDASGVEPYDEDVDDIEEDRLDDEGFLFDDDLLIDPYDDELDENE